MDAMPAKDHAGTQGWRRPRQVAMPGKASGDARLPSAGSDATFGGTQCRQRSCRDARLAKITPGRNARKSVRGRKARFAGMKNTLRYDARLAKSTPGRSAREIISIDRNSCSKKSKNCELRVFNRN